ncbi:hypothetical protein F2Q69_00056933 [Brassica cretica]|uniref:Uncharacterized protein n=1 Tax=Brassica cretica TaxID=69181 RepID=A0A8S9MVC7_BRACR|nr:hypothetical protein F2Q69_00056933 [Brassica cretica]
MGKYLVKLRNVDFLDSQRLGKTAPLGHRGSHSDFLHSSSSGHCNKYICGMEWGIFPAASPLRKAAPTLSLHSSSACSGFSMGSQSRWDVTRPLGHLIISSHARKSPILLPNHL